MNGAAGILVGLALTLAPVTPAGAGVLPGPSRVCVTGDEFNEQDNARTRRELERAWGQRGRVDHSYAEFAESFGFDADGKVLVLYTQCSRPNTRGVEVLYEKGRGRSWVVLYRLYTGDPDRDGTTTKAHR